MRIWLRVILLAVAVSLTGVGATFALFTSTKSIENQTFAAGKVEVVSWRAEGDNVPQPVQWNGWPAPMFYTTQEEGAHPTLPNGKFPTGIWAPGDHHARALMVRNVGSLDARLVGVDATLYGDLDLAPYFDVEIWAPKGQGQNSHLIYSGTLADLNGTYRPFVSNLDFLTLQGHSSVKLTYVVTLRTDAPSNLQGKTLKADFRIHAEQAKNRP